MGLSGPGCGPLAWEGSRVGRRGDPRGSAGRLHQVADGSGALAQCGHRELCACSVCALEPFTGCGCREVVVSVLARRGCREPCSVEWTYGKAGWDPPRSVGSFRERPGVSEKKKKKDWYLLLCPQHSSELQ